MPEFVLSNRAVNDLAEIWEYTFETWSEKQADRYYTEILHKCSTLSKDPEIGKEYLDIVEGLRGARIHKHIIFYLLLDDNEIRIERILHEQMDLSERLAE